MRKFLAQCLATRPGTVGTVGSAGTAVTWDTALFFASVFAYFFALPVQSDTSALVVCMTLCAILALKKQHIPFRREEPGIKWPLRAFAVFALVALIAGLRNPSTLYEFPRIPLWMCCVFSGYALGLVFPRNGGRYLWGAFAGIAVSFAVALVFGGYGDPSIWHDGRLKLFAIHPSRLALYAAAAFLFLLHLAVTGGKTERIAAVIGCLFLLFVLVKTNTRGNLLALPFGVLCLGAALPRQYRKRFCAAVLLCALLAGGAIWTAKDTPTGDRLVSAVTDVTEDPTFKSRLPIWEIGWESFKERPLTGYGYKSYLDLHREYVKKHGAELAERYGSYESRVKQAHNIVLGRLVETGVLGAACFFFFYIAAGIAAWRGPSENRWLTAPLIFYFGLSLLDDGLFRMNDAFIFVLAGNALACGVKPK